MKQAESFQSAGHPKIGDWPLRWSRAVFGRSTFAKELLYALWMGSTLGKGIRRVLPDGESVGVHPRWRSMSWNLDEYKAFKSAISTGGCALDVGANLGAYSLLLAQWVGAAGHVYAFEPNPIVAGGLESHVVMNGFKDRITIVQSAVSDRPGKCGFSFGDSIGSGRLESHNETRLAPERVDVESVPLDEFCRQNMLQPQFIKVDVEGAEFEVLEGARELIQSWRSNLRFFVELHPSVWERQGRGKKEWMALLDRLSLKMVMIAHGLDPWSVEGVCVELVPNRRTGKEGPGS